MAATAQAQAESTKKAQRAGIKKALESGGAEAKYRSRKPSFDHAQLQQVQEQLSMGVSPSAIAEDVGVSRAVVYRIKEDAAKMLSALETWG